ncbi:MAG: hypothetical protein JXB38_03155 [Anaerolineales bacterium]|nr:hypothetical protein [Anaerolineales bacterium]
MSQTDLQRAIQLLKAGKPKEAQPILAEIVKNDPNNETAWFVLSLALSNPKQQIFALQRVLRLNPNHEKARSRLDQLTAGGKVKPPSPQWSSSSINVEKPATTPEPPQEAPPVPAWMQEKQTWQAAPPQESTPSSTFPWSEEEQPEEPPAWAMPPAEESAYAQSPAAQPAAAEAEALPPVEMGEAADAEKKPAKKKGFPVSVMVMGVLLLCIVLGMIGFLSFRDSFDRALARLAGEPVYDVSKITRTPKATSESGFLELPPTFTPTATYTVTLTPPATFTPTPTATFTPMPLPDITLSEIEKIRLEVSELRGLSIIEDTSDHVLLRTQAGQFLYDLYITEEFALELEDEVRVLVALGMVKPTYDLVNATLNSRADNVGGFYLPENNDVYVIGERTFTGIEKYIYAHEFTHALQDQHYDLNSLGVYPDCIRPQQECMAIRALVEGDASLSEDLWWLQYAGPQDYDSILAYEPPDYLLPEDFPPPYLGLDNMFPYYEGQAFVEYLHNKGNWAEVNKAFANLPTTTEQILHPEKYEAGEGGIPVNDPPLSDVLAEEWRLLDSDALGEWMTFLLLGYGADYAGLLSDYVAWEAASGWGGDQYQVYYNDEIGKHIMSLHWIGDTAQDNEQFASAMDTYMFERFRGMTTERATGTCYNVTEQYTCLFKTSQGTLWILAPDQGSFELVKSLYPQFP